MYGASEQSGRGNSLSFAAHKVNLIAVCKTQAHFIDRLNKVLNEYNCLARGNKSASPQYGTLL